MQNYVVRAAQQCGLSPKFIASLVTGLVVYALTKLAIPVDPIIEQAINVLAMLAAAYIAPPGDVKIEAPNFDPEAGDVRPPATA